MGEQSLSKIAAFFYIFLFSTYTIIFLDEHSIIFLGREDGPIENIGALSFFIASVLFLYCYFLSKGHYVQVFQFRLERNIFYFLLSVLFFICFGEEISWGQRIFGWSTPDVWDNLNAQGETNIHNVWFFQSRNPDGTRKSFLELFLNMNRLFSIFWLSYCVIIPIIAHYNARIKKFFNTISFPMCPLSIGFLFVVNFTLFHFARNILEMPAAVGSLDELKETNYAIIFMIFSIYELFRVKKIKLFNNA